MAKARTSGRCNVADRIRIVRSENFEWAGIYINGTLFSQDDSINDHTWENLLRHFGHDVEREEVPDTAMEEMGELPPSYGDILREATPQDVKVNLDTVRRR